MKLYIFDRPFLRHLIVLRMNIHLTLLIASKNDKVEVHIRFQRLNFAIAVHYLQVRAQCLQYTVVLLDKVDCLMIDGTVHHRFRGEKAAIDEKVEKGKTSHT